MADPPLWEDGKAIKKFRRTVNILRTRGKFCCVPDKREQEEDVFLLCDPVYCGKRGRSTQLGCCSKPQHLAKRTCYEVMKKYLREEELLEYSEQVRTFEGEPLIDAQTKLSHKIFASMLQKRGASADDVHQQKLAKLDDMNTFYNTLYNILQEDEHRERQPPPEPAPPAASATRTVTQVRCRRVRDCNLRDLFSDADLIAMQSINRGAPR